MLVFIQMMRNFYWCFMIINRLMIICFLIWNGQAFSGFVVLPFRNQFPDSKNTLRLIRCQWFHLDFQTPLMTIIIYFTKWFQLQRQHLASKLKWIAQQKKKNKKNVKLQIMSIKREMQLKRRVFCMVYNALDDSSNAIKWNEWCVKTKLCAQQTRRRMKMILQSLELV